MSIESTIRDFDICDNAILSHGFTDYNRDYRIIVDSLVGPMPTGMYSYLFRVCVESHYETNVMQFTMDDTFIDLDLWEQANSPDGFVWGVKWVDAYPGWKYVKNSEKASKWARRSGIPMHEVVIETSTFNLSLVFNDLVVTTISKPDTDNSGGNK